MTDIAQLISTFVSPLALIMALVLMVSLAQRNYGQSFENAWLLAAMFAAALVLSMSDPIFLEDGGIFDMRGLLIGTAVALFGPRVALLVLATGFTYRIFIGPPGLVPGLFGMLLAYGAGGLFRVTLAKRSLSPIWKSVGLGLMISSQGLAIFLSPIAHQADLFLSLLPYIVVSNVLGCLLINHLIAGELQFLREADRLRRAASTDPMTGLLNRRGLEEKYRGVELRSGTGEGLAVLYFDLDHFKQVNDNHGHAFGDDILRAVAQRVKENLRPGDLFCRLGGDEFALVLTNIDKESAYRTAERCRAVISERPIELFGKAHSVSISLGCVWMLKKGDMAHVLDAADTALYEAKSAGRNRVVLRAPQAEVLMS